MIFSGCFRRTKTHNPFKHDRFVVLVRTSGRRERTRTSEGRRTGGKPRDRVGARARFPRALLRSFVRFRSSRSISSRSISSRRVRSSAGIRPSAPSDRAKKSIRLRRGGPSTRGFFAVRCGTDGWMDAVTDGRRATRRRRRATRARTMRKRRIPRGPTAATGDRGGDRRRAMARGVERRATNQPPVCVSWVVCVCHVCRVVTRRTLCLCV